MKLEKAFALKIKKILKAKKITQTNLEEKTGLSHRTINNILNCQSKNLNLVNIAKIIKALDMTMSEFFNCSLFDFKYLELDETNFNYNDLLNVLNLEYKITNFMDLALIIKSLGISMAEFFDNEIFDFNKLNLG